MTLRWLRDNDYDVTLATIDHASEFEDKRNEAMCLVDSFKHALYDHLNLNVVPFVSSIQYRDAPYNVLKDLCTVDTVLCTGEADQINELYDYTYLVNRLPARGLLSPYLGMTKNDYISKLESTNSEYVITGGVVSQQKFLDEVQDLVGCRISSRDLALLYSNSPSLFYALQTLCIRGEFANPEVTDEQIDTFCTALYQHGSKSMFQLLD